MDETCQLELLDRAALRAGLLFRQERVNSTVKVLSLNVEIADDALGVQDVDRRPVVDVVGRLDGAAEPAVPPRGPGHLLRASDLPRLLAVVGLVGIDPQ